MLLLIQAIVALFVHKLASLQTLSCQKILHMRSLNKNIWYIRSFHWSLIIWIIQIIIFYIFFLYFLYLIFYFISFILFFFIRLKLFLILQKIYKITVMQLIMYTSIFSLLNIQLCNCKLCNIIIQMLHLYNINIIYKYYHKNKNFICW